MKERVIPIGLVLFAAAAWPMAPRCAGQVQYMDSNRCEICHSQPFRGNDFCALVPAAIWAESDKHNRAFELLHETDPDDPAKGEAKRQLVRRILGFELRDAFADERYEQLSDANDAETVRKVAAVKACLRCHATWPVEADPQHPYSPPVPLDLGVSCQGCHGPGDAWERPHSGLAWRLVTPQAKASLGFANVRSPVAKAKLCASCHIGDIAAGKFVRHEWYAGGHPPLPGFELASFSAQMPVHWKPLRDKGAFEFRDRQPQGDVRLTAAQRDSLARAGIPAESIKNSYRDANFFGAAEAGLDPASDLPRVKDVIAGGVVAAERYARLVADYTALAAAGKAPWPELALYDCMACHHELRSRLVSLQRRGRSSPPGRPPLARWPMALAPLAVQQAAGGDAQEAQQRWSAMEAQVEALERATTARPFGDPAQMQAAAEDLAQSLDRLAADAAATRFDDVAVRRAVTWLTDPANYEASDFHSARRAAWAIRELAKDLRYEAAPEAYFDASRRSAAAAIAQANGLFRRDGHDVLALELPSGQQQSVVENQRVWLPAAARFDEAWFRDLLRGIREEVLE